MNMKIVAGSLSDLREKRERLVQAIAKICEKLPGHISGHDLERYHLGMVTDEAEFARLEEHQLWCGTCIDRADARRENKYWTVQLGSWQDDQSAIIRSNSWALISAPLSHLPIRRLK